jgi:hypothetical protein
VNFLSLTDLANVIIDFFSSEKKPSLVRLLLYLFSVIILTWITYNIWPFRNEMLTIIHSKEIDFSEITIKHKDKTTIHKINNQSIDTIGFLSFRPLDTVYLSVNERHYEYQFPLWRSDNILDVSNDTSPKAVQPFDHK